MPSRRRSDPRGHMGPKPGDHHTLYEEPLGGQDKWRRDLMQMAIRTLPEELWPEVSAILQDSKDLDEAAKRVGMFTMKMNIKAGVIVTLLDLTMLPLTYLHYLATRKNPLILLLAVWGMAALLLVGAYYTSTLVWESLGYYWSAFDNWVEYGGSPVDTNPLERS